MSYLRLGWWPQGLHTDFVSSIGLCFQVIPSSSIWGSWGRGMGRVAAGCQDPVTNVLAAWRPEAQHAHTGSLMGRGACLGPRSQNSCLDSSPRCGGLTNTAGKNRVIFVPGSKGGRDPSRGRQDAGQQPELEPTECFLDHPGHPHTLHRDGHSGPGPSPAWMPAPCRQLRACFVCSGQCSCPLSPRLTVL